MTTIKKEKGSIDCELEDLLFDVDMVDCPLPSNTEYAKQVIGQLPNEDGIVGDFLLNSCSDRYELVKNEEIFPVIEETLRKHNIEFEPGYSHINHARFYGDYNIKNADFVSSVGNGGDKIRPMLRVQHSYNGLTKYRIVFGYFRLICSNGLVIPVEEMKEYNLNVSGKHVTSIRKSLEWLNQTLETFGENKEKITGDIVKKYRVLGDSFVENVEDRIKEVLEATKIKVIDRKNFNTIEDIKGRIILEATNEKLEYNGRVNDWLVYNGINQFINDDSLNSKAPDIRYNLDSKVFEYLLNDCLNTVEV